MSIDIEKGRRIYFVSDSHLGVPDYSKSRVREKHLIRWLDQVKHDAAAIFLLGDIFDFWFEYSRAVPKGFVRIQGKIAEITDAGIPVHYFTGNHDMWVFDYFSKELGVVMHREPIEMEISGSSFFIGHGDGLGDGDKGYKILKAFFSCYLCQRLFAFLHPSVGLRLATFLSKRSRAANEKNDEVYKGSDKEWLEGYCRDQLRKKKTDFFVFGHRHLPLDVEIGPGSRYLNTGDWVKHFSYAEFDGQSLALRYFDTKHPGAL